MPKKKARKPARAKRASQPASAAMISTDGRKAYRLEVVSIDAIEATDHAAAQAYAEKMGGDLATQIDGKVLQITMPEKFKTDNAYWLKERYAGGSDYAWGQWFGNGLQDVWLRSSKRRVVVVRRSPL